jgi:hypothetical protein
VGHRNARGGNGRAFEGFDPTPSPLADGGENPALSGGPDDLHLAEPGSKEAHPLPREVGGRGPHVFVRKPLGAESEFGPEFGFPRDRRPPIRPVLAVSGRGSARGRGAPMPESARGLSESSGRGSEGDLVGVQEDAARAQDASERAVQSGQLDPREPVEGGRGESRVVPLSWECADPSRGSKVGIDPVHPTAHVPETRRSESEEDRVEIDADRSGRRKAREEAFRYRTGAAPEVQAGASAADERLHPVEHRRKTGFPLGEKERLLLIPAQAPLDRPSPGPGPPSRFHGRARESSGLGFRSRGRLRGGRPFPIRFRSVGGYPPGRPDTDLRGARTTFRPSFRWEEVPGPQPKDEGFTVGIGQKEEVDSRRLRVEVDAGAPREANALHVGALLVPDQQDERSARSGVLELDVDLAGGGLEPHLQAHGRHARQDEESGQVSKGRRHVGARYAGKKTWAVDSRDASAGGR